MILQVFERETIWRQSRGMTSEFTCILFLNPLEPLWLCPCHGKDTHGQHLLAPIAHTHENHGGDQDKMHPYNKLGLGQYKEPQWLEALDAQTAQQ